MTQAAPPPVDTRTPLVSATGLTKVFKDFWMRDRVVAVDKIDFDVRPGEIFGLLGPNGSGKSTTIKLILGLLKPTAGRIRLFGRTPEDVQVKRKIGYLPEESYLYRFLNARETLDFFGRLYYQSARERSKRIDTLLEMVGLQFAWRRPVGQYSKGMQRKIGLAQALINDPELLILDEPTTGMDPLGIRQTKELIVTLRKMGKTILLCSHQLAEIEDICDRVAIMYGGRIQALGTSEQLLTVRDETVLRTDTLTEDDIQAVDAFLTRRGTSIRSVEHPRKKLEVVFDQVIQDAQSGGLSTSGAVAGGAIPAFLLGQDAQQPLTDDQKQTQQVLDALVSRPETEQPQARTESQPVTDPIQPPPESQAQTQADEAEQTLGQMGLITPTQSAPEPAPNEPRRPQPKAPAEPAPEPSAEQVDLGVLSKLIQPETPTPASEVSPPPMPPTPPVPPAPPVPPEPSVAPKTSEASQASAPSKTEETADPLSPTQTPPSTKEAASDDEQESASPPVDEDSGLSGRDGEPSTAEDDAASNTVPDAEASPEPVEQNALTDRAIDDAPDQAQDTPDSSESGHEAEPDHKPAAEPADPPPTPDDSPASGPSHQEGPATVIDALVIEPGSDAADKPPSPPAAEPPIERPPEREEDPEADSQPEPLPPHRSDQQHGGQAQPASPEQSPAEPLGQVQQAKPTEDPPRAKTKKPQADPPAPITGGGLSGLYESVPPYQPAQPDLDEEADPDDETGGQNPDAGNGSRDEIADSSFLRFLEEAQSDDDDPKSKRPKDSPGS